MIVKMKYTEGVDIGWHVEDGRVIVDRSNLSHEATLALMPHVAPDWVVELLSEKDSPPRG